MPDTAQKIGVSFAVEGSAANDLIQLNSAITDELGSDIRFGPDGNSQPHVTVALGEASHDALARVVGLVGEAARTSEPFLIAFGPIARETVTGRYVLADVDLPDSIGHWRSALRAKVADHLTGRGRTTDEPHLTVAVVEGHDTAMDELLSRARPRIADCRVAHIDVAHARPRGAKGAIIQRFTLGDT